MYLPLWIVYALVVGSIFGTYFLGTIVGQGLKKYLKILFPPPPTGNYHAKKTSEKSCTR